MEAVVPGMRVPVEHAVVMDRALGEAQQDLSRLLAGGFGGGVDEVVPPEPVDPVARQHPPARPLGYHSGDADEGVALVALGELGLARRLQPVVELVRHAGPQFVHQGGDVQVLERELSEEPVEELGVVQVALDGPVHARVLNLHRHDAPVGHHRPVHLADGGGGDRHRVPVEEEALGVGAQLVAHHTLGQAGGHGGDVRLKGGQGGLGLRGQTLGDEGEHLARLHDGALHAAQDLGHVLGRADGELLLHPGPLLLRHPPPPHPHEDPVGTPADRQPVDPGLSLQPVAAVLVTEGDRARSPGGGRARERGDGEEVGLAHGRVCRSAQERSPAARASRSATAWSLRQNRAAGRAWRRSSSMRWPQASQVP